MNRLPCPRGRGPVWFAQGELGYLLWINAGMAKTCLKVMMEWHNRARLSNFRDCLSQYFIAPASALEPVDRAS